MDDDDVIIEVAGRRVAIGSPIVVEALFATISFRLEPDGWGSRFPVAMDHLREGRIDPGRARAALDELRTIEHELRALPAEKVIWDIQDRRPVDDVNLPVRHGAANAYDYFITDDGRPMLAAMREAAEASLRTGQAATVAGGSYGFGALKGVATVAFGLLWAAVGYLFFRDWIITAGYGDQRKEGMLAWPLGLLIALFGLLMTAAAKYPALMAWARRHGLLASVAGVAVFTGWMWLTWQRPPKRPLDRVPVFTPTSLPSRPPLLRFQPVTRPSRPATNPARRAARIGEE